MDGSCINETAYGSRLSDVSTEMSIRDREKTARDKKAIYHHRRRSIPAVQYQLYIEKTKRDYKTILHHRSRGSPAVQVQLYLEMAKRDTSRIRQPTRRRTRDPQAQLKAEPDLQHT